MKSLKHFSIPIQGLKNGKHEYAFIINDEVLSCFDFGLLDHGDFEAKVIIERMSGHWDFSFKISGNMHTECDRCTAGISIPLQASENYVIKVGEERGMNDKVIHILSSDFEFNVAKYLYESACHKIPIVKKLDCEEMMPDEKPCDNDTLEYLKGKQDDEQSTGSIWDSLKEIKFEN